MFPYSLKKVHKNLLKGKDSTNCGGCETKSSMENSQKSSIILF